MAAQLWGGPDSVLSHRSAAALVGLDRCDHQGADICMGAPRRPPKEWTVHRRSVAAAQIVTTGPFRHTDPLMTLVDLAAVVDDLEWELALESALRLRVVELGHVEAGGGRGVNRIRRVLARRPPDCPPTGSIRETQFIQLARTVEVDPFVRQYRVYRDGRCVAALDLCWPHLGLFIEIDGRWHDQPAAGPYDRHRQNEVVDLLGWRPLRFGTDDILVRPNYTARRLERSFQQALRGLAPDVAVPPRGQVG
jgi:very-short-patch-repair endonuclease